VQWKVQKKERVSKGSSNRIAIPTDLHLKILLLSLLLLLLEKLLLLLLLIERLDGPKEQHHRNGLSAFATES
jgi:hypothetical protein